MILGEQPKRLLKIVSMLFTFTCSEKHHLSPRETGPCGRSFRVSHRFLPGRLRWLWTMTCQDCWVLRKRKSRYRRVPDERRFPSANHLTYATFHQTLGKSSTQYRNMMGHVGNPKKIFLGEGEERHNKKCMKQLCLTWPTCFNSCGTSLKCLSVEKNLSFRTNVERVIWRLRFLTLFLFRFSRRGDMLKTPG